MTGGEIRWAFLHGVPVRYVDRVRGLDIRYPMIEEVIYRRCGGGVAVSALLISRADSSPSSTRARSEDIFFAKEEDAERCLAELVAAEAVS